MARVEIITGVERRRRWSEDRKREIVAAAFAPGAMVSTVARHADLSTGAIYRWRRELRREMTGFSEVVVAPGAAGRGCPSIEVVISEGVQARIPAGIPPELAAAVVKALVRR